MRLLVCLVFVAACTKKNPNYCEGAPDNLCVDSGGMACTSSAQCTSDGEKVCKLPEQVCVQCTTAEASACMGTTPICVSDKCAPCSKHADCPDSNVCLPDGSCAVAANVAYVASNGTNNATCDKATPCADVQGALAVTPPKSTIKIAGTITAATLTIANRDVTMLGENATLNRTSGDLLVLDGTSKVRLYDITLSNALGNTAILGINTFTGELELQRCTVTNNSVGIQINSNGGLILGRSTVSLNPLGGVLLQGTSNHFDITNNFIFRNGTENGSNYGGVNLEANTTSNSRLEFNTIVDNDSVSGSTRTGGVKCDITGFAAPNNIIARNAIGGAANQPTSQTLGVCAFGTSIIQADMTGLGFVRPDMPEFNYRIMAGSTAIDKATSGAMIMVDVDGESRPNGMARDLGADELH